jgi:hypothetical protein
VGVVAGERPCADVLREVHPRAKLGNRKVQHTFFDAIKALLPVTSRPIVIADSGFRVPSFRHVEQALVWDMRPLGAGLGASVTVILSHERRASNRLGRVPALVHRRGRGKPADFQAGAREFVQQTRPLFSGLPGPIALAAADVPKKARAGLASTGHDQTLYRGRIMPLNFVGIAQGLTPFDFG